MNPISLIIRGVVVMVVAASVGACLCGCMPQTSQTGDVDTAHSSVVKRYYYPTGELKQENRVVDGQLLESTWYAPDGEIVGRTDWQDVKSSRKILSLDYTAVELRPKCRSLTKYRTRSQVHDALQLPETWLHYLTGEEDGPASEFYYLQDDDLLSILYVRVDPDSTERVMIQIACLASDGSQEVWWSWFP